MTRAHLQDRGVIEIKGGEAAGFLQNLLTNTVPDQKAGAAKFTALLTPQGKIVADGFLIGTNEGFLFDCSKALVPDLVKKLGLYRLRAKVTIRDLTEVRQVFVGWNEEAPQTNSADHVFSDPRLSELGWRAILPKENAADFISANNISAYHAHRIALGIPEGGKDFIYGDAFPHEADMDQLNGVDFKKGCYIGQEVVSRMQHRGSARTRAVPIRFHDPITPASGTSAEADGKTIGTIGSCGQKGEAIAILRLDRVEDALRTGSALTAGGHAFSLETRPWIGFSVPRSN